MPHGPTIDHDDNVWLTDVGLHQVFKFTRSAEHLMTPGERGVPGADRSRFNLPIDVAVLLLDMFSRFGNYDGQFQLARDVAVGRDDAYVVDAWGQRVQKFVRR
jgi:hypothetical protein